MLTLVICFRHTFAQFNKPWNLDWDKYKTLTICFDQFYEAPLMLECHLANLAPIFVSKSIISLHENASIFTNRIHRSGLREPVLRSTEFDGGSAWRAFQRTAQRTVSHHLKLWAKNGFSKLEFRIQTTEHHKFSCPPKLGGGGKKY